MPANEEQPILPPGVSIPIIVGGAAAAAGNAAGEIGDGIQSLLMPDWLAKAGAYLTDRGTLIRIGTFLGGSALMTVGIVLLAKGPAMSALKAVK